MGSNDGRGFVFQKMGGEASGSIILRGSGSFLLNERGWTGRGRLPVPWLLVRAVQYHVI